MAGDNTTMTSSLKIGNATFYFPTKTSDLTNDSSYVNQLKTINNQSLIGTGNLDIATAQTQVDWAETDTTSVKYINNKPTIPSKTSDLTNDSSFITSTVTNLTNYYNKTTIDTMLSGIVTMSIKVVETLPTTGETKVIYLVKKTKGTEGDVYNEYLWIEDAWELIGTTQIDLTNYYTKEEVDAKIPTKTSQLTNDSNYINSVKTINGNTITGTGDLELTNKKLTELEITSSTYLTNTDFINMVNDIFNGMNPIGTYAIKSGGHPYVCTQYHANSPYMYLAFVENYETDGSMVRMEIAKKEDGTFSGTWNVFEGSAGYYKKAEVDAKIPTVYDSTITLSMNGNEYSFTANQNTDKTLELPSVPTTTTTIVVTDANGNETKIEAYIK